MVCTVVWFSLFVVVVVVVACDRPLSQSTVSKKYRRIELIYCRFFAVCSSTHEWTQKIIRFPGLRETARKRGMRGRLATHGDKITKKTNLFTIYFWHTNQTPRFSSSYAAQAGKYTSLKPKIIVIRRGVYRVVYTNCVNIYTLRVETILPRTRQWIYWLPGTLKFENYTFTEHKWSGAFAFSCSSTGWIYRLDIRRIERFPSFEEPNFSSG